MRIRFQGGGQTGFSLTEMTIGLAAGLVFAGGVLMMLKQHVDFVRQTERLDFIVNDAPAINGMLSRLFSRVDAYRVHANRGEAFRAESPENGLEPGRALWIRFRAPDDRLIEAVLAFEKPGEQRTGYLNYYVRREDWENKAEWVLSSKAAEVDFHDADGVLRITMTGPDGEEISYAGLAE